MAYENQSVPKNVIGDCKLNVGKDFLCDSLPADLDKRLSSNGMIDSGTSNVINGKIVASVISENGSSKLPSIEEASVISPDATSPDRDRPCSEGPNCDQTNTTSELIEQFSQSACISTKDVQLESQPEDIVKKSERDNVDTEDGIAYVVYESERQMPEIMRLITNDLSEPYSIYTYRYFIHNWPKLCFIAMDEEKCVGAIVCKHDLHRSLTRRGYIAMLAVDKDYRRRKIGSHLVKKAIDKMVSEDCDEVVLETEITNHSALALYEQLGFVRDKRLFRYYLNGVDALRLKLWIK